MRLPRTVVALALLLCPDLAAGQVAFPLGPNNPGGGPQFPSAIAPAMGANGGTAVQAPLVIPSGAVGIFSVVQASTYNGPCADVLDNNSVAHTIGFVNNVCDFTTAASYAQPVLLTKWYNQDASGHDLLCPVPDGGGAHRPTVNGSIVKGFIFNSITNAAPSAPYIFCNIPAGVGFTGTGQFSIFVATQPKYSIYNSSIFSFTASGDYVDYYTFADQGSSISGGSYGIQTGVNFYTNTQVPAVNGSVISVIGSGTFTVDGVSTSFSPHTLTLAGGFLGTMFSDNTKGSANNLLAFVVYPTSISAGNITTVQNALQSTFNIPLTSSYSAQVIADGDSITTGIGTTLNRSWPQSLAQSKPNYKVYNFGIPGQSLAQMVTAESSRITARFSGSFAKNILVVWAGTNDIVGNSATAATVYANLQTYTAAAKTAGFKVVWVTMLPRTDLTAPMQTQWTAYNALITGATLGLSNTADVVADVQGNATMGPLSASFNNSLYCLTPGVFSTGVHPTDLGYTYITPIIISAVASL